MSTQDPAPGDGLGAGWDEPLSPISPSAVRRRGRRNTETLAPEKGTSDGTLYRILDAIKDLQAQTTQLSRRVQSLESAIRLAGVDVPNGDDTASVPSGPGLGRLRRRGQAADKEQPAED